jgi:hypothetical protein
MCYAVCSKWSQKKSQNQHTARILEAEILLVAQIVAFICCNGLLGSTIYVMPFIPT